MPLAVTLKPKPQMRSAMTCVVSQTSRDKQKHWTHKKRVISKTEAEKDADIAGASVGLRNVGGQHADFHECQRCNVVMHSK